jgi:hypothetical protein
MSSSHETCFGYRVRETDSGWSWVTYDDAGQVQAMGEAPSKAIAAACVIRALARAAAPGAAIKTAA